MANEQGAMFDEFSGGGLLDDADVAIKSARFVQWDYKGKIVQAVLALRLELEDAEGQVHEDHLSAGELKFFVPSSDGSKAIPVGTQTKLNMNTNAVAFIVSLMNADTRGQLAQKLRSGDSISVIEGARVHVERKPQPKRAGILQPASDSGQGTREKMRIEVTKVLAYPGEAGSVAPAAAPVQAGQATPAQAAAPVAAAAPAVNGAVSELATNTLLSILAENGGAIKQSQLAGKVFSNPGLAGEPVPTRNAVLGMIVRPDYLNSLSSMGIKFDGTTVSLG